MCEILVFIRRPAFRSACTRFPAQKINDFRCPLFRDLHFQSLNLRSAPKIFHLQRVKREAKVFDPLLSAPLRTAVLLFGHIVDSLSFSFLSNFCTLLGNNWRSVSLIARIDRLFLFAQLWLWSVQNFTFRSLSRTPMDEPQPTLRAIHIAQ